MAYPNRVIVRVWTSEKNKKFPGQNVGHVSIEVTGEYMSLFPNDRTEEQIARRDAAGKIERKYLRYFGERTPDLHRTLAQDIEDENDIEPSVVICFYTLDCYQILNEFHVVTRNTKGWRLIGRNLFFQTLEGIIGIETPLGKQNVDSCVSLARKLLSAGGLEDLINLRQSSSFGLRTSSYIEVDDILDILIPAKLEEIKNRPDTQHIIFPGETPIEILREANKSACVIS